MNMLDKLWIRIDLLHTIGPPVGGARIAHGAQKPGQRQRGIINVIRVGFRIGFDSSVELLPSAGHDLQWTLGNVLGGVTIEKPGVGVGNFLRVCGIKQV